MGRIINYILEPILQEDKDKMIEKFKNIKEEKVDMKTAQDYIREEIQEIKRKSREEGREEGGRQIIINMIKNKVELSKIKQYTGIDEKEIQRIAANM